MTTQIARIDNVTILTNPSIFEAIRVQSEIMADARALIPEAFRGKKAECMAIAMQAARWGLDPFVVANQSYLVSGQLAYSAQLVNSVITAMAPTKDRINYEEIGDWSRILGRAVERTGKNGNKYMAPGWDRRDENGLGIRVFATMKGEDKPRVLTLMLTQAQVRNSTLWASDPLQQLKYLGVKRWARLHCPDVILGVYSGDELEEPKERDITPQKPNIADVVRTAGAKAGKDQSEPLEGEIVDAEIIELETVVEPETVIDENAATDSPVTQDELIAAVEKEINACQSTDDAEAAGLKVNELRPHLGENGATRLRALAMSQFRRFTHKGKLEDAINSLPTGGTPEGAEAFQNAYKVLLAAKRHITPEEFDGFTVTLNDMAPEYQA